MTHEEAQALWLLGNDGALDAERHAALDTHMVACVSCRDAVLRLTATDRALHEWGAMLPAAPASLPGAASGAPHPAATMPRPWWPIALAAGLTGIALGFGGGVAASRNTVVDVPTRRVAAPPLAQADGRETFVLMLEEPASQWPPPAPLRRPGYFEWLDSLAARGEYAGGERLSEDEGRYVMPDGTAIVAGERPGCAVNFSGMFLVRARDYDDAVSIARGSPHLQFGGVLVRRVY